MTRLLKLCLAAVLLFSAMSATAHIPENWRKTAGNKKKAVQYRDLCAASTSSIDQEINNVRARLQGGGDCWWDLDENGRYIVPKVDVTTGQVEVSSIFAGSVWLGGFDPAGNLKLACQDYRPSGQNDFWPGPLQEPLGITEAQLCVDWNKHFKVTGEEIRQHLRNLEEGNIDENAIPFGVRGWPGKGNPYFFSVYGFDLPNNNAGLAGFFDADDNGKYDPLKGDYPSIEIRNCPLNRYPDEMIFWIYNDEGGGQTHARTNGRPIRMEVQVQAFGYVSNDELNDMTFQRYKLINRATEFIDSTYFAMWTDPDLGCSSDDYIGCDIEKSLMYVYNQDPTDGQPGTNCDGVPTYGDKIPILGIDYFRGPLRLEGDTLIEIGMSSFTYYNRGGPGSPGNWPAGMTDPDNPQAFYNYISGSWADGNRVVFGGSGYDPNNPNAQPIPYVFPDAPNDPSGWSMCTANLAIGDRRTLQASGPFRLNPGAVNELIIGIPWVPEQDYPCPSLDRLFRADLLAQGLFDNCFETLDGPDAPTVNWIELNREVVAVLTNEKPSNNINEAYRQQDFLAPESLRESTDSLIRESTYYKFEGYLVYQLNSPNVTTAEFEDIEKSRLVANVDIKNGVTEIYNWIEGRDPGTNKRIYFPEKKIDSEDAGIRRTFSIKEDKFATGNDKSLINHKKYYFAVIAYAYNNFETFNPLAQPDATGQSKTYLPSRKSATGGQIQIFTVVPRPIIDQELNSKFGDGVAVTRLSGVGTGSNFLDLDDNARNRILDGSLNDSLHYKAGRGPVTITIFNPFEVKDGDYELEFLDGDAFDNKLDVDARWQVKRLSTNEVVASEKTIEALNEQLVPQFGFSVAVAQAPEPGDLADEANGAIGFEVEYADSTKPWLLGFPDQVQPPFDFVSTTDPLNHPDYDQNGDGIPLDPEGSLSILNSENPSWFVPYVLADYRLSGTDGRANQPNDRMITPAWTDRFNNVPQGQFNSQAVFSSSTNEDTRRSRLALLPNVDIVLTSDKSKWSRCVVIETASQYWTDSITYADWYDPSLQVESPANRKRQMFDVRYGLSVGKDDNNGDGLPDPDGAVNPNDGSPAANTPLRGMGWFPGYAVNVETGERLNVFFGENSCYRSGLDPQYTGRDMLFNPTGQIVRGTQPSDYPDFVLGGQHFVYVTYSKYDECDSLRQALTPERHSSATNIFNRKVPQIRNIAWCGMLQLIPNASMLPLSQGLVPNECRIKLRVSNSYKAFATQNTQTNNPRYLLRIRGLQAERLDNVQIEDNLDSIKAVPNPYYGFSQYETSQFSNTIKITNLPGKCTVTIYSLDGKFIRQYERDETYQPYQQISPDLEWDLKNNKGIPVASGVYLIHINAPGQGERTIKWFGVARQFDPTGL